MATAVFSNFVNAIDFAQVRSKDDARLLYEAKYGERKPDGKMSREQYYALRCEHARLRLHGTGACMEIAPLHLSILHWLL